MTQYLKNKPLTIVSPGDQKRDFTHVKDIVKGLLAISKIDLNDEYQLGTGRNYSILEIAKAFGHPYEIVSERKGERFEGVAIRDSSVEKIGWEAEINVIDYIKNFVKENKHE